MPARELQWYPVPPQVFHDGYCEHADVRVLEHSVGPAGYEVARYAYNPPSHYEAKVWYGNRGHAVTGPARTAPYYLTAGEAKAACQAHYDRLVDENTR